MDTYGGVGVLLTSALGGGEWSDSRLGLFTPGWAPETVLPCGEVKNLLPEIEFAFLGTSARRLSYLI
jgi:hypothetical protein